ncbi:MAG: tetraacyldisaccharide 4'-kinase [Alphaproteobacteria bacterium]|nr:tetraacyldisaccharide 4'-kinase [Alphaproteobacteria bacterium]
MKAPTFWYRKKSWQGACLAPLGHLYRLAGLIRRARAVPYRPRVPLICVGNIVAGGAGKTPTCLALHKLLVTRDPSLKIGFVTRGYGGREKGPLRVDPKIHSAADVGDEALLLARAAPCWIGRDRAQVAREAEKEVDLLIMDDGMQNPTITPSLTLLVIDGAVGLGNGKLIPAGPLRETLNDAFERVSAIVMIGEDAHHVATYLGKPVFNAKIMPGLPTDLLATPRVIAFAGIGRPSKFYDSCRTAGLSLLMTRDFPDHHVYRESDLAPLRHAAQQNNLKLITTSKDYVRLPPSFKDEVRVLDIALAFEEKEKLAGMVCAVSKQACAD